MSLTDRAIINLKPTGKSSKHFDGGGLHIFLSPSGGKLWRLVYTASTYLRIRVITLHKRCDFRRAC